VEIKTIAKVVSWVSMLCGSSLFAVTIQAGHGLGGLTYAANTGAPFHVRNMIDSSVEELPSGGFALDLLKTKDKYGAHSVTFGGYAELDAQAWHVNNSIVADTGPGERFGGSGSGVYATTMNLDALGNINDWASAFVSFEGDNITTDHTIFYKKAFVLLGDLKRSPFYSVLGADFLSWGVFTGNGPWSVALPRALFRASNENQAVFGYSKNHVDMAIALLNNHMQNNFANFSYEIQYGNVLNKLHYSVGAGYLFDMRGVVNGYGSSFNTQSNSILRSTGPVGVYDLNASLVYDIYGLQAEYMQGTRAAYVNNAGIATARPNGALLGVVRTWSAAVNAAPTLWGKPTVFQVSYSGAANTQDVPISLSQNPHQNLPANNGVKRVWIYSITRQILHNVFVGLEYQNAKTYKNRYGDVYTLDFSVYF